MIHLVAASLAALGFVSKAAAPNILYLLANSMGYGDPRMLGNGDIFERYPYDGHPFFYRSGLENN